AFVSARVASATLGLADDSMVRAVIALVALGANQIAHIKNPMSRTRPPTPRTNLLRKVSKFGTLMLFLLPFGGRGKGATEACSAALARIAESIAGVTGADFSPA